MPILNLRLTAQSNDIELSGHIPSQHLNLKMASIQFNDTANTQSAFNIKIPFMTRFQIHNSQSCNSHLTLPIKVGEKSTVIYPNLELLPSDIPSSFRIELFNADGTTGISTSNLVEVQLWFEYSRASLF